MYNLSIIQDIKRFIDNSISFIVVITASIILMGSLHINPADASTKTLLDQNNSSSSFLFQKDPEDPLPTPIPLNNRDSSLGQNNLIQDNDVLPQMNPRKNIPTQQQQPIGPKVSSKVRQELNTGNPVRVIITLSEPSIPYNAKANADNSQREEAIARVQETLTQRLVNRNFTPGRRFRGVPFMVGTITLDTLMEIETNSDIVSVVIDEPIYAQGNGVTELGVDSLHLDNYTGAGVTIVVLDNGLNPTHTSYSSISDDISHQHCFTYGACLPENTDESDSALGGGIAHGTIVSDIITGTNGYAPDAEVIAVRVLNDEGSGFVSDWLAGLEWVSENKHSLGIDIVNMSLGTADTFATVCDTEPGFYSAAATLVNQLVSQNVVIVAATGNSGLSGITAPACLSNVIAVGATYVGDLGAMPQTGTYQTEFGTTWPNCADSSTNLDTVACFSNMNAYTDIVAPGVHVDNNNIIFGTSFSSPAVAGVIALMRQANPLLSPQELRQTLKDTGTPTVNSTVKQMNPQTAVNSVIVQCDIEIADGDTSGLEQAIDQVGNSGIEKTICLAPNGIYSGRFFGIQVEGSTNIILEGRRATISGDVYSSLFNVQGGSIEINNLVADTPDTVIWNFATDNGAILYNGEGGTVVVKNSEFNAARAIEQSGGISSIFNSMITNSHTNALNAIRIHTGEFTTSNSIFYGNGSSALEGGAIFAKEGTIVTIFNTLFENNMAHWGGAIYAKGSLTISNSAFIANTASGGGAIEIQGTGGNPANAAIENTTFSGNTANSYGGDIYSRDATTNLNNNKYIGGSSGFHGGSLYILGGSVNINGGIFDQNTALYGSGIYNSGGTAVVVVNNATFINNASGVGIRGVIYNSDFATAIIDNSTFLKNVGVAIENKSNLTVTNSTFLDNMPIPTSSVPADQAGAVRTISGGITSISSSTFVKNGRTNIYTDSGATTQIKNSIVAASGNVLANCDGSGTFITAGVNFTDDANCAGFTQVTTESLGLGIPTDNGGATETIALANGSVAVDAVPINECTDFSGNPITSDQRGGVRSYDDCDAGAFEYVPEEPTDDFAVAPTVEQVVAYGFNGTLDTGSYEINEPTDCIASGLVQFAESHHLNFTGRGRAYSWVSGRARAYSFRSGDLFYLVDTTDSDHDTVVGVYKGSELQALIPVECNDDPQTGGTRAKLVVRIPDEALQALEEYHIIIWNKDKATGSGTGTTLNLNIKSAAFQTCTDVSEILERECEALFDFFYNTGGLAWINSDNWIDTNLPCETWYGVDCSGGHITDLTLDANNVSNVPNGMTYFEYFQSLIYTPVTTDIVVNTTKMRTDDDGECSLIEAIIAANSDSASGTLAGECIAGSGDDVIQLGTNKTYFLYDMFSRDFDDVDGQPNGNFGTGLPDIVSTITIEGNGSTITRSDTSETEMFRIFKSFFGGDLILVNATISNGVADNGGAILCWPEGSIILIDSTVSDNKAIYAGGGIYSFGTTTITVNNSKLHDNSAGLSGGAIAADDATSSITITGSEITNNTSVYGGAVSGGSLLVDQSVITHNSATSEGGAIQGGDSVIISDSIISYNTATGFGAGLVAGDITTISNSTISHNTGGWNGGGIWAYGAELTISGSTIVFNQSGWGGGIFSSEDSDLNISSSIINNNRASDGGGIYIGGESYGGGSVSISSSAISNNEVTGTAGGIRIGGVMMSISDTEISHNRTSGASGGIHNVASFLVISNSTINHNSAKWSCGGICGSSFTTVRDSTIAYNESNSYLQNIGNGGGGINVCGSNGYLTIEDSAIYGNYARRLGGGIYVCPDSEANITNTTISGNIASDGGYGIANIGGTTNIVNSTIWNNEPDYPVDSNKIPSVLETHQDIATQQTDGETIYFGTTTLEGSIVGGSTLNQLESNCYMIYSNGYNISDDSSCNFNNVGDLINTDPLLRDLMDNEGLTFTHSTRFDSLARDAIPVGTCAVATDQRGMARPVGNGCDIGAFEALPNIITEQEMQVQLQTELTNNQSTDIDFILVDFVPNLVNLTVRIQDGTVGNVIISVSEEGEFVTIQIDSILINNAPAPESYVTIINRDVPSLIVSSLNVLLEEKLETADFDLKNMTVSEQYIEAQISW